MMRSINLAIPEDVAQQLERLAEREFRRPRDEAAHLLVQAVRRAALGLLPRDEGDTEPSVAEPDPVGPASDAVPGTDALYGAR